MRLGKMGMGELYSFVEAEEQERMKKALRYDPLEEARKNLLERAEALFPDLKETEQPTQVAKAKKTRSRERTMPLHFVLKPRK